MRTGQKIVLLSLAGAAVWYVLNNQTDVETAAQAAESDVEAATMGWQNAGSGPTWVPILNSTESQYGLPQNLLAALAYQESSFIENVIRGLKASSAGAMGMMQLMPQYYPTLVGSGVPVPYSDQNVSDQITAAATTLVQNYSALSSWPLAIAAYNAGVTAVENAGGIPQNGQTPAYVAGILGNAPAANS